MKLVEDFIRCEPALYEASRRFVAMFSSVPDPVVAVAQRADTLDAKIAWTLLGSALFQERSYPEISALLEKLFETFPNEKLWTLPVPKAAEIEGVVESVFRCRYWTLFEHVAGIFWSVGLFVRQHGCDLVGWAASRTPEEMWRDLGEIYFMGKAKPRPKACAAIYRLISSAPQGLEIVCKNTDKKPPLPLTMGARRYLSFVGPAKDHNFSEMSAERKQVLANELFCALDRESPYRASHALQFFLEMGKDDFICRERTRNCSNCPMLECCGYADNRNFK